MNDLITVTMVMVVSQDAFDRVSYEAKEATGGNVDVSDLIDEKLKAIFGDSAYLGHMEQA